MKSNFSACDANKKGVFRQAIKTAGTKCIMCNFRNLNPGVVIESIYR
jgi:hypothetical protein